MKKIIDILRRANILFSVNQLRVIAIKNFPLKTKKLLSSYSLIISGIISLFLLDSCTEDINLSVVGGDNKIVIEGSIENGAPAKVIITRNSPLGQTLDYNNLIVSGAKVYVSNGSITDTLKFNYPNLDLTSSFPFLFIGTTVIGVPGQTYYLTVIADDKTYTSITTIPQPVQLDSVWWKEQPLKDSLGFAWAHFSEPPGIGNAYKWSAKRPTKDNRFISPYASSFDDRFIDGKSFDFAYNRGTDPNATATAPPILSDEGYFKNTDTIYIKFCSVDFYTSRFYSTYEAALQTNGNPFASPSSIIGNINGGALGVWGGFGCSYDTIMPSL